MPPRKAQIIKATGELRRRAVNFQRGFSVEPTREEMAKLEEVVHRSTDKFIAAVGAKLKSLRAAVADQAAIAADSGRFLAQVRRDSLDVKGFGGTFNFPLLTQIGKSLNDFVEDIDQPEPVQLKIVGLHVDALYVILAGRVTGQGGKLEAEVMKSFGVATRKFK
jgi:hypothetical protein